MFLDYWEHTPDDFEANSDRNLGLSSFTIYTIHFTWCFINSNAETQHYGMQTLRVVVTTYSSFMPREIVLQTHPLFRRPTLLCNTLETQCNLVR